MRSNLKLTQSVILTRSLEKCKNFSVARALIGVPEGTILGREESLGRNTWRWNKRYERHTSFDGLRNRGAPMLQGGVLLIQFIALWGGKIGE